MSHDNQDIENLLNNAMKVEQKSEADQQRESQNIGDQWQDVGPYLIFLILPLMLVYFRRGVLVCLLAVLLNITSPQPVYANTWDSLWKTSDQQAQEKFNAKSYTDAADQFTDPLWQGSAHYKAGDYEKALSAFEKVDSPQSLYNQGNALAKLQKFDEAIAAYDKALKQNPNLSDAQANKEIIEALKQQQEQQQDQSGENSENSEDGSEGDQQESENQDSGNNSQNSSENGDSNKSDPQQSDQQQSDEQGAESDSSQDQSDSSERNEEQDNAENKAKSDAESKENETDNNEAEDQTPIDNQAEQSDKQGNEAQAVSEMSAEEAEKAKEMAQKHQQLLNKVTDDPYMLIRNKMKLEYRNRRHNQSPSGVQKQW